MMDLMAQETPNQTQTGPVVPPVITTPPEAFEPKPAPSSTQFPTPAVKKFDQLKALGWVLALVAVVFILLIITAIGLNFTGQKTQTDRFFTPPQPAITPPISTPSPTVPESGFNIGQ